MSRPAQQERPSRTAKETAAYRRAVRQLGVRVKELRTERGWTLEHSAELADMDLKHWQKIEAGQLNVTMVTLVRMAGGLGCAIANLFGREPPSRRSK